ncbi:MAG: ACP S-malonyltransferase [Coriobacteriales bacterium]|jgi:[acyl-carrier-protein] S-malonyltransferase|nr:ACP S-malonyltransferase [Coriobacteriales bacterium]
MTKTAWIYAGQGSQKTGMGKDFYNEYPEVRPIFESEAAGFDLKKACFEENGASMLADTRYTQAAMAAFAAAVTLLLKNAGLSPAYTAGLSLGEYSALHAADVFGADALLDLLAARGTYMADASEQAGPSRMSAVLGLDDASVIAIVEKAQQEANAAGDGIVAAANFNSPGQVVIGGNEAAVARAEAMLKEAGAKRCIPLKTSGPFHTPLMQPAAPMLSAKLQVTPFSPQHTPVVFNITGRTAKDERVKQLLTRQISNATHFADSLRFMADNGVDDFIEIGPGHALAGFVKKTLPGIPVRSIQTIDDLKLLL